MKYSQRLHSLQSTLPPQTALLISNRLDLLYLTGFEQLTEDEREGFLLITNTSAILWLSSFSPFQPVSQLSIVAIGIVKGFVQYILPLLSQEEITVVQVDTHSLLLSEFNWFQQQLPNIIQIQQLEESKVMSFRMIKDENELNHLLHANTLTHQAVDRVLGELQGGETELELLEKLESLLREEGVAEMAFPTIIAFGEHTALPHHQPSNTPLQNNTCVLIDCGARWKHYCADTTRTVWFGDTPDPEFLKIEQTVKEAYEKSVALLATNNTVLTAADLDKAARDTISKAGYGDKFIHTTGHGVGLAIHEQPSLNINNSTPLQPNMVITVEPGIYLENRFGYRYENSIVITPNGCEVL